MTKDKTLNVKATGIIAIAVMCSRVLGLIREVMFNALFGSSSMGIFLIAFRAPNLLRDLFAEGALSISFVTIFSRRIETEGDASAWQLAYKMLTLTTVFMSILSILGVVYSKQMIAVLAPGLSPQDAYQTVLITQIMYPFILLVSIAAVIMGMLNSKNVFGVPALASSFFNLGSIVGGIGLGWFMDPSFGSRSLIGLAIGTLLGGLLQLMVQIPSLSRLGFKFKPDFRWRDKGIKDILILTWPAIIAASAVQINVLIGTGFASYLGKEAVTWLNSAFRLMQLPIGLFGVAVATITLPVISRISASKDTSLFAPTLNRALRLAVFLTLPAAAGLLGLAYPIISMIYEHGKFLPHDAWQTALALQYYALGLVSYSCIKVLSPAFYTINKKWTPMFVSFASIALNIVLSYVFVFYLNMGHCGLALATILSATLNGLILLGLMQHHQNLNLISLASTLLRCGLAASLVWLTCLAARSFLGAYLSHHLLIIRSISLLFTIAVAASLYVLVCLLLKIDAAKDILTAIGSKKRQILQTS